MRFSQFNWVGSLPKYRLCKFRYSNYIGNWENKFNTLTHFEFEHCFHYYSCYCSLSLFPTRDRNKMLFSVWWSNVGSTPGPSPLSRARWSTRRGRRGWGWRRRNRRCRGRSGWTPAPERTWGWRRGGCTKNSALNLCKRLWPPMGKVHLNKKVKNTFFLTNSHKKHLISVSFFPSLLPSHTHTHVNYLVFFFSISRKHTYTLSLTFSLSLFRLYTHTHTTLTIWIKDRSCNQTLLQLPIYCFLITAPIHF